MLVPKRFTRGNNPQRPHLPLNHRRNCHRLLRKDEVVSRSLVVFILTIEDGSVVEGGVGGQGYFGEGGVSVRGSE